MHRLTAGLGAAAVLAMSAALGAQSTATTPTPSQSKRTTPAPPQRSSSEQHEVNVTGCLAKASDGRFTVTNARVEPIASASATTTSTAPTTAGTTGTTTPNPTATTEPAGSGTRRESAGTWWLAGGSDLEKHVGQQVQVTGKTSWDESTDRSSAAAATSTTASPSTTAADSKGPELEVQSIKMIASSCS